MEKYLEIGQIVNTHGVRGDVKAQAWCDSPTVLASLKTVYLKNGDTMTPIRVEKGSRFKDMVLLHLAGCDSMEQALRYKNRILFADRDDIPHEEGSFFIADLCGLTVYDAADGRIYGKLRDVIQGAAGEIYEIETPNGTVLMPAVKEYVASVDLEKGIAVTPIPGFFEEEADAL